jgi:hypothetical protein
MSWLGAQKYIVTIVIWLLVSGVVAELAFSILGRQFLGAHNLVFLVVVGLGVCAGWGACACHFPFRCLNVATALLLVTQA